jgi:3-hydroxyisobutyrate dehydrogenase
MSPPLPPPLVVRRIGLVGLGDQGRPIARRLLDAGWPLSVHARRAEVAEEFRAMGAAALAPEALARASDLLLLVVVDSAQLRDLLEGQDMLSALRPGSIVAVHSTITPDEVRSLGAAAAREGIHLIDTPVSGGRDRSYAGDLAIFAGGEAAAIDAARPAFAAYASRIVRLGEVGAGQAAKLLNNYFYAAHLSTAAKAIELIDALGIDRVAAAAALPGGSGASAAFAMQAARGFARTRHDKGSAHAAAILHQAVKDLRALARRAGVSLDGYDRLVDLALAGEAQRDLDAALQREER